MSVAFAHPATRGIVAAALAVLLPLMPGPVLLGRVWTIGLVTMLGLLCLREYDRATGLFR